MSHCSYKVSINCYFSIYLATKSQVLRYILTFQTPSQFIDDLLELVDIVDVINVRVPLKHAGKNLQASCPFHKEKTPSFFVSPDKQFYHCFGCGAHGTAIGFLMEYEQMSFYGAINYLANYAGISITNQKGVVNRIIGVKNMEHSKWKDLIVPLLSEQSGECVFGKGKRDIKSNKELHIYLGTSSSKQVGSAIYNAIKAFGGLEKLQSFEEYRKLDDYNFNEPEEFSLGSVYLENREVLIGWDYFDDSMVFIPWDNITSMRVSG
mgnify:CR=1 FL=1